MASWFFASVIFHFPSSEINWCNFLTERCLNIGFTSSPVMFTVISFSCSVCIWYCGNAFLISFWNFTGISASMDKIVGKFNWYATSTNGHFPYLTLSIWHTVLFLLFYLIIICFYDKNPSHSIFHISADHRSLPAAHHGEVCKVSSSVGSFCSQYITISSSFTDAFLPSSPHNTSIRLALRRLCYRRCPIAGMYPSEAIIVASLCLLKR